MRPPTDLHQEDLDIRVGLRQMLVERRKHRHLSQTDLADRMGISKQAVSLIELGTNWRLSTVQRWARALRWRLVVRPDGLPVDPQAELLDALRPTDPDQADRWDQSALVTAMTYARVELGVEPRDLGVLLGHAGGVRQIEAEETGLMFATPQRYCRALGGSLWVGVEAYADRLVAA